jgi:hypothetical protein
MRLARIVCLVLGSAVLVGCGLFFPPFGMPGDAFPSAAGTYTRGKATITITTGTRQVITLDRVSPGPHLYTEYGAEVRWLNDDGWALGLMAPTTGDAPPATIWIDRIVGKSHLTTQSMGMETRCIVDVTKVDASRVSGKATCKGLRWTDVLAGGMFLRSAPPVANEPPFDAEIAFEASS